MKKFFQNYTQDARISLALLILRVLLGVGMMLHGLPKIQNPTAWAGDNFPAALQLLAAVAEFGGGIAWIIGLLVPLASFGLMCTMAVAVHLHAIVRGDPFVGKDGSYELAAIYLAFSVVMLLIGPGRFSLDQMFFKGKR